LQTIPKYRSEIPFCAVHVYGIAPCT